MLLDPLERRFTLEIQSAQHFRIEIHNPGLLLIGVTPRNILHTSSKRNPHLANEFVRQVFPGLLQRGRVGIDQEPEAEGIRRHDYDELSADW